MRSGTTRSVDEQKVDDLCERLVLLAELVRSTKSPKVREKRIKSLSQTANEIVRPKFDAYQLRDALEAACVERPDFGDPIALDGKNVAHITGSFDLETLAFNYFKRKGVLIDGEKL